MAITKFLKLAFVALSIVAVAAHPKLSDSELVNYQHNLKRITEAIGRCIETDPNLKARMMAKRAETFGHLRQDRGSDAKKALVSREFRPDRNALAKWQDSDHEHKGQSKDPQDIFDFKWGNDPLRKPAGCALSPESIYGPFWAEGHPRRQDIRSRDEGIPMRLALQVIDVSTCKPMWNSRVDVWQANAIGQYDPKVDGALRGWQPTSKHGTVDFDTIFPGHYPGRASHIHVSVRPDNKPMAHVGQIYFEQRLRDYIEVKRLAPLGPELPLTSCKTTPEYTKNSDKKPKSNMDDTLAPYSASKEYDPFAQYSWLSEDANDGLLAWIVMGVNASDPTIEQPPKPN
ncbi:aromatic compound dioxygenase [Aaosphaeria arxii CBS 175.79]|uniref:Aromatic compound dioxygenase n=1 Tax=Aaosphaeria arxii CBS 175.79 TaxID=1450172 RepID=A0A6A5X986_9PLEO|nr:aromatic compound dioxygenase [Aaosphaeria arxii CBS 175.79]KAF2009314.1 aromatic compound dioxygenase [Aaosphaeria arxii CBS 175.79]